MTGQHDSPVASAALIRYEAISGIGTITLDSPHNRNALSSQLVFELYEALERAAGDDAVRVIVLESSQRVFCSGADLSEAATGSMEEGAQALVDLQWAIVTLPKPVVACLRGPVRAGGLGIIAASDFAISSDDVTFAFTESRLALAPAVISLTVLPRLTSRAASDVLLTGRTFDAREAASMGLITRATSAADFDTELERICADLLAAHPQGVRETKALISNQLRMNLEAHSAEMAALSARLFNSDAAQATMQSFLGKP